MAADQGGNNGQPVAQPVSREKILHALASLMANKDAAYVAGVRSRAAKGNLQIKGESITAEIVDEALTRLPKTEEKAKVAEAAPAAGARWTPSSASIASIVSKALMECEDAEQYMERVRVVGDAKVAVLPKPDVNTTPTGEFLCSEEWADTVARMVNRKDGRVYVRLRNFSGWVSSRSRNDYNKVVLDVEEGKAPLEPGTAQVIATSRAMRLLPHMTQEGYQVSNASGTKVRRFRTTVITPILQTADCSAANVAKLQPKEEFLSDGAFLRAADGRAYLHLKDGKGWICERTKSDFSKLAIEPCGSAEDLVEEIEEPGVPQPARARAGGKKKVFLLEHAEVTEVETVAHDAAQPGADAEAAPPEVVFRSDAEIWPEEYHPPKPIGRTTRLALRRLFVCHGKKVKECEEDLKEVTAKAATFGRACPAQKELLQYAEDLKKEMQKAKKEWSAAVKKELSGSAALSPGGHSPAKSDASKSAGARQGSVMPVQVRGGRWFCAMLGSLGGGDEGGNRQCGPLRPTEQEASEDLQQMLQAKVTKRKASDSAEAPAPKKGRAKAKAEAKEKAEA